MAAYSELPSFVRPGTNSALPRRRCLSPRVLLFGIVPAAVMLGVFLLLGAPSLSLQRSGRAIAAQQTSSFGVPRVAAEIAAAAVLLQQRPLRAALPQGGQVEERTATAPAASAAESADGKLPSSTEAKAGDRQAAAEAEGRLNGDGSVIFYSDDFDDIVAYDSAADAGMVKPDQLTPQQSASKAAASDAAAQEEDAAAAAVWYGTSGSSSGNETSSDGGSGSANGGSGSGHGVKLSQQDADIAAILEAALQGEQPVNMAECLREKGTERPFTVEDFLKAVPARLKVEAEFRSQLPRAATAVTMFVAGTMDRKDMLVGLCKSYGSVISLAVYVGFTSDGELGESIIADTVYAIKAEFDRLEAAGACQLDILVVSERLQDEAAAHLFPINALRNLALLNARTELVMLGDMDLLAGADLRTAVSDVKLYQELLGLTEGNRLVVVPAFESDSKATAQAAAAGGKAMAASLWKGTANFRYFLQDGYEPAHEDTRFDLWVQAEAAYALNETDPSFEPWWIGQRADVSVFDARYRGYGKNKVQHLQMLKQLLGVKYVVHPRAFVVHRPHPSSTAKNQFEREIDALEPAEAPGVEPVDFPAAENLNIFVTTEQWFGDQWRAAEAFRPLVTPGFKACRDSLPHWNVFGPNGEPVKTVTKVNGVR